MAEVTILRDFEAEENKTCHCFHFFPFCLSWSATLNIMILVLWMLSFKAAFLLSSFTFIKRLLSSSSLSAISVLSSASLRLLIFLPAILTPACDSSSLAFHVMYYSAYLDFPGGSQGKESTCSGGDLGLILKLGRSPGGEHGNPLHYSCLENPMDKGAWWAIVHGIAKS